jgi:hypothetical protein
MSARLVLLAVVLMGCESYATRTRGNAGGGAYVLTISRPGERILAGAIRGIIDDMQRQCHGSYEVTAIDRTPTPDEGYYLDANDEVAEGPFRTTISYECGEPQRAELNHRLYTLAGPTLFTLGHGEHFFEEPSTECVETWDCPVGKVCEAKPCDVKPAK